MRGHYWLNENVLISANIDNVLSQEIEARTLRKSGSPFSKNSFLFITIYTQTERRQQKEIFVF